MINPFAIRTIQRVIAHRILQKTESSPCYADTHDNLYKLNFDDKQVLIQRIEKAVNNRKSASTCRFVTRAGIRFMSI